MRGANVSHFFELWNGAVTASWWEQAEEIAKRHGAHVVICYDPAAGLPRGWIACPNHGEPFDDEIAAVVLNDLTSAGLWDGGTSRWRPAQRKDFS